MSKAVEPSTTTSESDNGARAITKSKALRAKTTRRAAQPAKPREAGDAVSVLLAGQRRLLVAAEIMERDRDEEPNPNNVAFLARHESAVGDRLAVALDELAYLKPKTSDGAVFALVAAFSTIAELENIADADLREHRKRRANRLLFGVLRYLLGENRLADIRSGCDRSDNLSHLVRKYMPPWEDPVHALENARTWGWGIDSKRAAH